MKRSKSDQKIEKSNKIRKEVWSGPNFYLIRKILIQLEKSDKKWQAGQIGNLGIVIQQTDYDTAGKTELLEEAEYLEKQGLLKIKWLQYGNDIEKVVCRLEQTGQFYELLGLKSKSEVIGHDKFRVQFWEKMATEDWVRQYYEDLRIRLEKGIYLQYQEPAGEDLFQCLNALEKQKEPIYERVFSAKYMGGSKVLSQELKDCIVRIARKYHPMVDEAMGRQEVLSQLYLEDYSQELAVKGSLNICLQGTEIDLEPFIYGLVLNTDTINATEISVHQHIKKIITVENKANFYSMPIEKGTLIIFTHGFLSPRERRFLCKLYATIKSDRTIQYFHTGDLDYGGIRIFRYIRENIFPDIRPLQMDADWYECYVQYGYKMKPETLKKLEAMRGTEPLMEELIEHILKGKMGIEQECFLI